jgi:arylsulfatase A-like enzyme
MDDQLRADAVGYAGGRNVPTPNIDRLAGQGMVFENALATCPLCTPYRGQLITGRHPTQTGIVQNFIEVNPRERSIAREFGRAGYRTGFIGKWHLAAGWRKRSGKHLATEADRARVLEAERAYREENPEECYVPPGPGRLGFEFWAAYNFHCDFHNAHYYGDSPERKHFPGYETDGETDVAITFMESCRQLGEPFFLVIAPHPPHPPWRLEDAPEGCIDRVAEEIRWPANVPEGYWADDAAARVYYSMVANVDDNVGRLMEYLDRTGQSEDTAFVFTSDHGDMMGSHGRMNKMVPYAEAVRVPLVIRQPGTVPGGRTDLLQGPLDHMPTLLSMAGLPVPDTCMGADLSGHIVSGESVDRSALLLASYTSHWDFFDSGTEWPEWRGLKTPTHTYCRWLEGGREELYHDLDDPCQLEDLAAGNRDAPLLTDLRRRLDDSLHEARDEFLPGTAYADWYDDERNLVRTGEGEPADFGE